MHVWLPAVDAHRVIERSESLCHESAMWWDHVVATRRQEIGTQILWVAFLFYKVVFFIVVPDADCYLVIGHCITVRVVVNFPLNFRVRWYASACTFWYFLAEFADGKFGQTVAIDPLAIFIQHLEVRVGMVG